MPVYAVSVRDIYNDITVYRMTFTAENDEEAWEYVEDLVKDMEEEGWDCMYTVFRPGYICSKIECEDDKCHKMKYQIIMESLD